MIRCGHLSLYTEEERSEGGTGQIPKFTTPQMKNTLTANIMTVNFRTAKIMTNKIMTNFSKVIYINVWN